MYLLPLLFSNLHLGLGTPTNPIDLFTGTLGRNLARSRLFSRFRDRYSSSNFHGREVLDFYPYTSWRNLNRNKHVISTTSIDSGGFKITVNVQQYNPEEITVKVVDNWVIIKGMHEKQNKSNVGSQQFVIRYLLPGNSDIDHITSSTSSDGILTIMVPLKNYQKVIQIEQSRQSAVSFNNTGQVRSGQIGMEQIDVRQAGFAGAGQAGVDASFAGMGQADRVGQVGIGQADVGKADGINDNNLADTRQD
ncbi:Protein lethal(2)essential for life [Trachymyrmex septentrionalis]|uniref:Protein lethal(2)essential for life n=1 Tax=Trachymyrmex septentrionalis TaxID=34720 RepID=A0A195F1X3_9HYME|nr:PREDICTED: protein lethal(2)essential for life-like [Trachymyrmex septentrionalis]KYN34575.1 Protein lethal(2)essential for life [Trachymyrmex septentrionalis]